jgi:hypothetical protein|nr:hypothetical protein [Neorhizobium tomejilense]
MSTIPAFLRNSTDVFVSSMSRPSPVKRPAVDDVLDDLSPDKPDLPLKPTPQPPAPIVEPVDEKDETEKSVPPVYVGGARLVTYGTSPQLGMTVTLMLRDVGPREVHPLKGLKYGKSNGQRFKTWMGPYSELIEINSLTELESVYSGETMNLWYGDTCDKGVVVKLGLDSGPDGTKGVHPFGDEKVGKVEGMDIFISLWAINDDETIIPKKAAGKRTPFHQLSEVRQSNLVVRDEEFVNFLSARLRRFIGNQQPAVTLEDGPTAWAIEVVRLYLGGSRGIMNEENLAGLEMRKRWKNLMAEYFQSDEYHARRQYFGR